MEIAILELGWGLCSLLSGIKGQTSGDTDRQESLGMEAYEFKVQQ